MRHVFRRLTAGITAVTVAVSIIMIPGCSKKGDAQGGNESASWYEYTRLDIQDVIDYSEYAAGTTSSKLIGVVGDRILVAFFGSEQSHGTPLSTYNEKIKLIAYDKTGNNPEVLSLDELMDEQLQEISGSGRFVDYITVEGDRIRIDMTVSSSRSSGYYYVYYDPATELFSELTQKNSYSEGVTNGYTYVSSKCDGYGVSVKMIYSDISSDYDELAVSVLDPDGQTTVLSVTELDSRFTYCSVGSLFRLSENMMLLELLDYEGSRFVQVDLASKALSVYSGDVSVLDTVYYNNGQYVEGIGNIISTGFDLKLVDLEAGSISDYFDYNCCNLNMALMNYLDIDHIDSDIIVMSGTPVLTNDIYDVTRQDLLIYVLTRSDADPNEGKQIIRAAALSGIDYVAAEGICRFNEQSTTHRIIVDPKYNMYSAGYNTPNSGADISAESLTYNSLMMDIMNGDGPDIIFDAYGLTQLCNDQYLMDLSDIALPDDAFMNVFDSAVTDGKLYIVPLAFDLHGIFGRRSDMETERAGFTFDQYDEFVHGVCNGSDPTAMTSEDFFINCLKLSGITDYRSDEFWEIAEYSRDRYLESVTDHDDAEDSYRPYTSVVPGIVYAELDHPFWLIDAFGADFDDLVLTALPSSDGRGSDLLITDSVAISAGTEYTEQCREFVELLLSPEVQGSYTLGDGNPISHSGVETVVSETAESYNRYMEYLDSIGMSSLAGGMGFTEDEMDPNTFISVYESMIDSCSGAPCLDSEQEIIIREEMGAYFAGQKTPDEIADLIENRLATMANERG
ncbi:MAG: extracellular solute-binding protein [Clostridiales bacterium]|nr:extracellular solute-binding protein [Clostridiales bacterium]